MDTPAQPSNLARAIAKALTKEWFVGSVYPSGTDSGGEASEPAEVMDIVVAIDAVLAEHTVQLAAHSNQTPHREWANASAWLYPGDYVSLINA